MAEVVARIKDELRLRPPPVDNVPAAQCAWQRTGRHSMHKKKILKEEAVERMRANTTPLLDLAREYGVSTNTLRNWLRQSQIRSQAQEDARRVATTLSQEDYASSSQRERLLIHALEYSPGHDHRHRRRRHGRLREPEVC